MKRNGLIQVVIILILLIVIIKFVPPVNNWARGSLPESILTIIGEKPKSVFEKGADLLGDGLEKGKETVQDLVDTVKKQ